MWRDGYGCGEVGVGVRRWEWGVGRLVLVCMWGCGCCEVGVGVVRWVW